MRSPTSGRVSQGFSWRHTAVDIVNAYRTPLAAPISGKVTYVGRMGSGVLNAGNVVQIEQGNQLHRLCHLDSYTVTKGQMVGEGDLVGYMGYSGFTIPAGIRGTHLHWIMMVNGRRVDARNYVRIPASGSTVTPKHPFGYLVGRTIKLEPKNKSWKFYRRNSDIVATTVRDNNDLVYLVRDVSSRANRVVVFSKSGGGLVDVPLASSSGAVYKGEWRII